MSPGANLRNIAPASLADLAKTRDLTRFLLQYGGGFLLAVRVGEDDLQLASGLDGSAKPEGRASTLPGIQSMDFHTAQASAGHLLRRVSDASSGAQAELTKRL